MSLFSSCSGNNSVNEEIPTPHLNSPTIVPTKVPTQVVQTPTTLRPTYLEILETQLSGVTVSLIFPWLGEVENEFKVLVEKFNQENEYGIRVLPIGVGGEQVLFDFLQEKMSTAQMPNISIIPAYQALALDGNYFWLDLTPYVEDEQYGIDLQGLSPTAKSLLVSNTNQGKIIGIPAFNSASVIFYNRTWAEELGFTALPLTIESLQEQSCAAYQSLLNDESPENNGTGGLLLDISPETTLSWYFALGGRPLSNENPLGFNNSGTEGAFRIVKSYYDQGCFWQSRLPEPYDYFSNRLSLAYTGKLEDIIGQVESDQLTGNQDDWLIMPFPTEDKKGSLLLHGKSFVISISEPEEQLASWLFLRWILEEQQQMNIYEFLGMFPFEISQNGGFDYLGGSNLVDLNQSMINYFPARANWQIEQLVIEDAFTRLLALDIDSIPIVLSMLDETLLELWQMENFE